MIRRFFAGAPSVTNLAPAPGASVTVAMSRNTVPASSPPSRLDAMWAYLGWVNDGQWTMEDRPQQTTDIQFSGDGVLHAIAAPWDSDVVWEISATGDNPNYSVMGIAHPLVRILVAADTDCTITMTPRSERGRGPTLTAQITANTSGGGW